VEEIIGNDVMFGTRGNDIRSQYSKHGLYIQQNRMYDMNGGIQLINMLSKDKRFIVHAQCIDTLSQLDEWNMETTGSAQLSQYGLGYAIVNMLSRLKQKITPEPVIVMAPKDYGRGDQNDVNYTGINPWEFM
jgi:hypothetical protein